MLCGSFNNRNPFEARRLAFLVCLTLVTINLLVFTRSGHADGGSEQVKLHELLPADAPFDESWLIFGVIISPDSNRVALWMRDSNKATSLVHFFESASDDRSRWKLTGSKRFAGRPVWVSGFSHTTGEFLLSAADPCSVLIIDCRTMGPVRVLKGLEAPEEAEHSDCDFGIRVAPDDSRILLVSIDTLIERRLRDGKLLQERKYPNNWIFSACYGTAGDTIYVNRSRPASNRLERRFEREGDFPRDWVVEEFQVGRRWRLVDSFPSPMGSVFAIPDSDRVAVVNHLLLGPLSFDVYLKEDDPIWGFRHLGSVPNNSVSRSCLLSVLKEPPQLIAHHDDGDRNELVSWRLDGPPLARTLPIPPDTRDLEVAPDGSFLVRLTESREVLVEVAGEQSRLGKWLNDLQEPR